MAMWGLRWHADGRPDLWWNPKPQVKLWAFATSAKGAFVIVEADEKPHPQADLLTLTTQELRRQRQRTDE
jgi:hypothetical protein